MIAVILGWVIRLVCAVLAFLLVEWLLPMLLALLAISPPDRIIQLVALLIALLVLTWGLIPWPTWRRVQP